MSVSVLIFKCISVRVFADDEMPPVILHVVVAALQHCWLWLSALMFGICSEGFGCFVYNYYVFGGESASGSSEYGRDTK